MSGRIRKTIGQISFFYLAVLAIYIFDQSAKIFAERYLSLGQSIPVINNIFHITLVHNQGAAFGMFKSAPFLFVVTAVAAVFLINYILIRKDHVLKNAEKTALIFILSGTVGNLTDRVRLGYVIDFIDFRVWPVFNIADSFITIGAVILVFSLLVNRSKEAKR